MSTIDCRHVLSSLRKFLLTNFAAVRLRLCLCLLPRSSTYSAGGPTWQTLDRCKKNTHIHVYIHALTHEQYIYNYTYICIDMYTPMATYGMHLYVHGPAGMDFGWGANSWIAAFIRNLSRHGQTHRCMSLGCFIILVRYIPIPRFQVRYIPGFGLRMMPINISGWIGPSPW